MSLMKKSAGMLSKTFFNIPYMMSSIVLINIGFKESAKIFQFSFKYLFVDSSTIKKLYNKLKHELNEIEEDLYGFQYYI